MESTSTDNAIEFHECAGTRIYALKKYLSPAECDDFISRIRAIDKPQGVFHAPVIAQQLWQCIGPKITAEKFYDQSRGKWFQVTGIANTITITNSNEPTPRHKDANVGVADLFKLAFYLNKIPKGGGTIFYSGDAPVLINNDPGSGILFDLALSHQGEHLAKTGPNKLMIGARPHVQYEP